MMMTVDMGGLAAKHIHKAVKLAVQLAGNLKRTGLVELAFGATLRELLYVFEQHRISLTSIHSSRTPAGEVHFRIGFDAGVGLEELRAAAQAIDRSGLGRVLEQP